MAVIKIVPMPGAVGDKGDEGAVGPRGQQGETGLQGPAGADALWSYNGEWQVNSSYATGDVITYQGQLYYTKSVTTAGTLPTDITKFDLIASKGADGQAGTNGTNGTNGETPFTLVGEYNNGISYGLKEAVYYNGGTYVRTGNPLNPGYPPTVGAINESWTPIAEKGEQGEPGEVGITSTSGTWDAGFTRSMSALQESSPSNKSFANYYVVGDLVHFDMNHCFENTTSEGQGTFVFRLPVPAKNHGSNLMFNGVVYNTTNPSYANNINVIPANAQLPMVAITTSDSFGPGNSWVITTYQNPMDYAVDNSSQMSLDHGFPGQVTGKSIRFSGVYRKE